MFGMRPQALLIILLIVGVLVGAKKLPQVARGMGQSLRIFKSETRSLIEDDDDRDDEDGRDNTSETRRDEEVRTIESPRAVPPQSQTDAQPESSSTSAVGDSHGRES